MYMYDHIQQVPIPFRSFDTLEFIRTHPSKHKQMANMLQDNARYTCHICALNTYFTWTFTCQWYKICAHVCVCNIYIYIYMCITHIIWTYTYIQYIWLYVCIKNNYTVYNTYYYMFTYIYMRVCLYVYTCIINIILYIIYIYIYICVCACSFL